MITGTLGFWPAIVATASTGSAAAESAATAASVALVTIGIVFAALLALGFAVIARRTRASRSRPQVDDSATRAGSALVRLDDDVTETGAELGYAIAQFGEADAAPLATALASARTSLAAAFAIHQRLDDASPASPAERRESIARIVMLCDTARERLSTEREVFDAKRALERSAARDLDTARTLIAEGRRAEAQAGVTLAALTERYAASAIAPVSGNPAAARDLLDSAETAAARAEGELDESGINAVSSIVMRAERDARRAIAMLGDIRTLAETLDAATTSLERLTTRARVELEAARLARDTAPTAAASGAIGDAIEWVERTLAGVPADRADPQASIARIESTTDALDTALAGARTEAQRLEHARKALSGAIAIARSQIDTTRAYIAARRGGVGAEARTRLAEAERVLSLAEVETEPVAALDLARSSATFSRDADALARYDLLQ